MFGPFLSLSSVKAFLAQNENWISQLHCNNIPTTLHRTTRACMSRCRLFSSRRVLRVMFKVIYIISFLLFFIKMNKKRALKTSAFSLLRIHLPRPSEEREERNRENNSLNIRNFARFCLSAAAAVLALAFLCAFSSLRFILIHWNGNVKVLRFDFFPPYEREKF